MLPVHWLCYAHAKPNKACVAKGVQDLNATFFLPQERLTLTFVMFGISG